MARMTPQEANAVNVVATHLATQPHVPHEVSRALEVLASRAHNRIQTGWDENAVRRPWPAAFGDLPPDPPATPGPKVVVNVQKAGLHAGSTDRAARHRDQTADYGDDAD